MTRTAVVAGVGPGLGAAIAHRFAAEGCRVALLARTEPYLDTLAASLADADGEGLAVPTDLTDAGAVEAAFETVREAFGPTDVLVYNASGTPWKGLTDIALDEFDDALATGPRGALLCAREAAGDMLGADGEGKAAPSSSPVRPPPSGGGRAHSASPPPSSPSGGWHSRWRANSAPRGSTSPTSSSTGRFGRRTWLRPIRRHGSIRTTSRRRTGGW
jgi:NAD(P)-dependent dehydrogenase (short-subunit alcohol dehydrogenase family)